MTMGELIEKMAYAMHTSAAHSSFWSVDELRVMAAAATAAIETKGLAIVPVEATPEMLLAALTQDGKGIWPAMIEAGRI